MEGNGRVRRFFSALPKEAAEDTPAIRRKAPRNVSLMFIRFSVRRRPAGRKSANVGTAALNRPSSAARLSSCGAARLGRELYPRLHSSQQKSPAAAELGQTTTLRHLVNECHRPHQNQSSPRQQEQNA